MPRRTSKLPVRGPNLDQSGQESLNNIRT